ncbi:ANTAR domain-containing response regulator [Oceanirhabdus sp. W0125-5]|uniref:ANTAR domain-containing response regulator n=1 Tax=Oceanirhabdus sp. W0125-5 TaxID=2999116 RepID=UPI0022F2B05A|nr:response regulator [Oceanirhabdus sp. W0125-5]WBW94901.1 response regulator [Oceanirhabdus sp. W0125-5]
MKKKIVIADDEPITRIDLREILEEANYDVVGEATDGFDAVELCKKHLPDLVLMDIKMPLLDGINAANIIMEEELANSVILLTAYSGKEFIEKAKVAGVMGYLVKPIDDKSLLPAVEIALSKGKEIKKMKKDIKKANEKLEARKKIEKAKGILMRKNGMNEDEAYNKIRALSMNKRVSMKEIADILIMSNSINNR